MPNDQYLLYLGGVALLFWWVSSGSKKVVSMEDKVQKLQRIYTEFLKTTDAESRSWFLAQLGDSVAVCQKIIELRERFQEVTYPQLEAHLGTELPQFVGIVKNIEKRVALAKVEVVQLGRSEDADHIFTSLAELETIERFISVAYALVRQWSTVCGEVFSRLPNESTASANIMLHAVTKALAS